MTESDPGVAALGGDVDEGRIARTSGLFGVDERHPRRSMPPTERSPRKRSLVAPSEYGINLPEGWKVEIAKRAECRLLKAGDDLDAMVECVRVPLLELPCSPRHARTGDRHRPALQIIGELRVLRGEQGAGGPGGNS